MSHLGRYLIVLVSSMAFIGCSCERPQEITMASDPAANEGDASALEGSDEGVEMYVGYDIDGERRSCEPADSDIICSMVYTREDEFADKCHREGHEVLTCGCHDHLCSVRIDPP